MRNCKDCLHQDKSMHHKPCVDCDIVRNHLEGCNWEPKDDKSSLPFKLIKLAEVSNNAMHWSVDEMLEEAVKAQKKEKFEQAVVIFATDKTEKSSYLLRVFKRGADGQIVTMLCAAETMEIRDLVGTGLAETMPNLDPEA